MADKDTYKTLRKNTLIIAISNIGSKAVTFILAPLYSYYLTTSQYGIIDLIITTVSLMIPFYCLDIYEATFRFSSDKKYNLEKILTSSLAVCVPGFIVTIICLIICLFVGNKTFYVAYTMIFISFGAMINILSQFARGQNKMRVFATTGVINSVGLLVANIMFLICLRLELNGWLISYFMAQTVTFVYLMLWCGAFKFVKWRYIDKEYIQTFIRFCAPLIPTAAMWWVMNASDRYMITFFLNSGFNGIYSVANKLPSILSVFENVFYQSWQTTAITTMHDSDRDRIYSDVFIKYLKFLTIGVVGLLVIGRPMIIYLFASNYSDAWICLAPLILSVLVHALAGNLGSLYSVFKNTKGAFYSTIAGAAVNIILNIFFIPQFGILGAALTTLVGYIVTLIYRWFDVKKFVHLKISIKDISIYISLIIVQFVLYYINHPVSYFLRILLLLGVLFVNRVMIVKLIKK